MFDIITAKKIERENLYTYLVIMYIEIYILGVRNYNDILLGNFKEDDLLTSSSNLLIKNLAQTSMRKRVSHPNTFN